MNLQMFDIILMKTIKLSYNVKNYLYPFKLILNTYEVRQLNVKEVDQSFTSILSTLILGLQQQQIITGLNVSLKNKFVQQHNKLIQHRSDHIGVLVEEHSNFFAKAIASSSLKSHQQYYRYLKATNANEQQVFAQQHIQLILSKLQFDKNIQIDYLINFMHIIQIFVENEACIKWLQGQLKKIINCAVSFVQRQNFQIKVSSLKILTACCNYLQDTYEYFFQELKINKANQETKLNLILDLLQTNNLLIMRPLLKFLNIMILSAVLPRHIMQIATQCIQCDLIQKLDSIKKRINQRKYSRYDTFEEYTNLSVLELQTQNLARTQIIQIHNEKDFNRIKEDILYDISKIIKKFTELNGGKLIIDSNLKTKRQQLKKKYARKVEKIEENIVKKKENEIQINISPNTGLNPIKHILKQQINKQQNKLQEMYSSNNTHVQKAINNGNNNQNAVTFNQIIQNYEFKLLDKFNQNEVLQSEINKLQSTVKQLLLIKNSEKIIERDKLDRENKQLKKKIKQLQSENDNLKIKIEELENKIKDFMNQKIENVIVQSSVSQDRVIHQLEKTHVRKTHNPRKQSNQFVQQQEILSPSINLPPLPPLLKNIEDNFNKQQQTIQNNFLPPPLPFLMIQTGYKNNQNESLSLLPPPPLLPDISSLMMPTSIGSIMKKKISREPKIPMKMLPWTILDFKQTKGTFWQNVQQCKVDFNKLQQLFCQKRIIPLKKTVSSIQKKSLVTADRARNIELILKKMRIPIDVLRLAMYSFDQSLLTYNNIISLLSIQPLPQQIEIFQGRYADISEMVLADQYLQMCCNVRGFTIRLRGLKFKIDFREMADEYFKKLEYFYQFFNELRQDKLFQTILKYVLTMGNFLNSNSLKGGAFGFRLQSLERIGDIKNADGKKSLFNQIIEEIRTNEPEVLQFKYIHSVYSQLVISSKVLLQDLKQFHDGQNDLQNCLLQIEDDQQDKIAEYFLGFFRQVKKQIKVMQEQFKKGEQAFRECIDYYGEHIDSQRLMELVISLRGKLRLQLRRK